MREERLVRRGETGVCRLRRGGEVEAGSLSGGECWLVEGERLEAQFEVLVDLYGMGRVEWRHWDMFTGVSIGSVSYHKERYVASLTVNSTTLVGDMSLARGLSGDIRAWATNQTVSRTSGQVVVELEPVRYQVERLRLGQARVVRREEERADTTTRTLSEGETVEVIFTWKSSQYWGHVEGLVRGLPSLVEGEHCVWGVTTHLTNTRTDTLIRPFSPGSHLNLTTILSLVTITRPYTALLTAIYRDGLTIRHNISAELQERVLDRVSHYTGDQLVQSNAVFQPTTTSTSTASTLKQLNTKIDRLRKKIFKKSLQSENLIESRISSRPQRYKENPLKIFYPDDDSVEISNLRQEKNISGMCSSSDFKLWILVLSVFGVSL